MCCLTSSAEHSRTVLSTVGLRGSNVSEPVFPVTASPLRRRSIDVNRLTVGTITYEWAYERANIETGVIVC